MTARIIEASAVLGQAAAIRAAAAEGVLDALTDDARSAAAVARGLGLDERITARLLETLAALSVVDRGGAGGFRLASGQAAGLAAVASWWDALPQAMRTGRGPVAAGEADQASRFYPDVVGALGEVMAGAARAAADLLSRPGLRVLDVAAGAAPWSLALLEREPEITVTALDLPDVIAVTRQAVAATGLNDRYTYLAGDVFEVTLTAEAYDLIVVGNLCHLFGFDRNRRLLGRLRPALAPGGELAIIDLLADGPPTPELACYRLGLALRTADGDVYPLASYQQLLSESGFAQVSTSPLAGTPPVPTLIRAMSGRDVDAPGALPTLR
jgi:ubiquinone/menaquinone biosynthesis C-methylase UbiE